MVPYCRLMRCFYYGLLQSIHLYIFGVVSGRKDRKVG